MPLVLGLALRTSLRPVLALILIARPADRESADAASSEEISVNGGTDSVAADLTNLTTRMLRRFLHWFSPKRPQNTQNSVYKIQYMNYKLRRSKLKQIRV